MKIFAVPPIKEEKHFTVFLNGISFLESLGHTTNVLNGDDTKLNSIKFLNNCDVVIFDSSLNDFNSGFLFSKAIALKKLIIFLEFNNVKNEKDVLKKDLISKENKNVINIKYSKDNINDALTKGIKQASQKLDSKFILIIPSEIDRYLQWASENKKLHKAQIVRDALEQVMKRDREYRDSLN